MLESIGVGECYNSEPKTLVCADDSIRGRLLRRKREHEERLQTINEALEALDKNPELTRVIELVNKAR